MTIRCHTVIRWDFHHGRRGPRHEANFENLYKLDWMQKYDDEERQLKSWRREKVNLSKIETDDPEMSAKIKALTLKIEEKEKELTEKYPSKGAVFLGKNPLLPTNKHQPLELKKVQFTQLHDKGKSRRDLTTRWRSQPIISRSRVEKNLF